IEGETCAPPEVEGVEVGLAVQAKAVPAFERSLQPGSRDVPMLDKAPWIRSIGKWNLEITTQGWRFPAPGEFVPAPPKETPPEDGAPEPDPPSAEPSPPVKGKTHIGPPNDMVILKDRLLYLLQPPLEDLFAGRQVQLPFHPYPYQVKGIAFLMPRHNALI